MGPFWLFTTLLIAAGAWTGGTAARLEPGGGDTYPEYTNVPGTGLYVAVPEWAGIVDNLLSAYFHRENYITALVGASMGAMESMEGLKETAANSDKGEFPFYLEELKIGGYDALLFSLEVDASCDGENEAVTRSAMMLLMGDSTFSAVLTADYDYAVPQHGEDIRRAFLSVRYDPDHKPLPGDFMPFTAGDNRSGFTLSEYVAGAWLFEAEDADGDIQYITVMASTAPEEADFDRIINSKDEIVRLILGIESEGLNVERLGNKTIRGNDIYEQLIYEPADDEGDNGIYVALVREQASRPSFLAVVFHCYWKSDMSDIDKVIEPAREFAEVLSFRSDHEF